MNSRIVSPVMRYISASSSEQSFGSGGRGDSDAGASGAGSGGVGVVGGGSGGAASGVGAVCVSGLMGWCVSGSRIVAGSTPLRSFSKVSWAHRKRLWARVSSALKPRVTLSRSFIMPSRAAFLELMALVERAREVGPVPGHFPGDQGQNSRLIVGGGNLPAAVAQRQWHGHKVISYLNLHLIEPMVRGHGVAQCFPSRNKQQCAILTSPKFPGHVVGLEREFFGQPIGPLAAIGVKRALDPLQDPRLVGDQELTTDVDLNTRSCLLLAKPVFEFRSRLELRGVVLGQLVDERLYRRGKRTLALRPSL